MIRHPHADVIHAWAEGAEVEYKRPSGTWKHIDYPHFSVQYAYRVKPKEPEWWENIPEHGVLAKSNEDDSVTAIFTGDINTVVRAQDWTPLTNEEIERFKR